MDDESKAIDQAYRRSFDIDQWPKAVRELSVETHLIRIPKWSLEKMLEIAYGQKKDCVILKWPIVKKLDDIMGTEEFFIRLNTRSPKDYTYPQLPITCSGKVAMRWIMLSLRTIQDIETATYYKDKVFVCLRKKIWHMPALRSLEFRCFVKNGKLIGVTQYYFTDYFKSLQGKEEQIKAAIHKWHREKLRPVMHQDFYVFDVLFQPKPDVGIREEDIILLEINPYGLSDPCLYESYERLEAEKDEILIKSEVGKG